MLRMDQSLKQCIDICNQCHQVCLSLVEHCLQQGGKHADANHIRLLLDCAQICQVSADFMLRQSPLHRSTCRTCAESCLHCASSCAGFGDDALMQECERICRECARSCRQMSGAE